jgi:hypothetical protein
MNLIISSSLSSDPPSEGLYFRFLTMVAKKDLDYSVVIESEKEKIDYYYHLLKEKGWFDFVDDFVIPEWDIEGVRLDIHNDYPMTIKAKYIRCENTPVLLGQIKSMRNINEIPYSSN